MPFSPQTLDFLVENRLHDSRDWFKEHKEDYKKLVIAPFIELVEALTPTMLAIDPLFITEPRVDRTISRVNRDTRFSKDKSLYRENMWCIFIRDKKLYHGLPAFYVDISPEGFSYGCGYYQADTETVSAMRQLVLEKDKRFKAADKALRGQELFHLEGDVYKRPHYPDHTPAERNWLERRSLSVNAYSKDFPLLFSKDFAGTLKEQLPLLTPIYSFFLACEERRNQNNLTLAGERGI